MKILFTSYEALAILRGGPKTQLLQTKFELEKLGVKVDLFDMWESFNPAKYDLVHLFAANISTHSIARNLFPLKLPIVTSPIFFTQHSSLFIKSIIKSENIIKSIRPGFYTDYGITKQICDWSKHLLPNTIAEAKLISGGLGQSKNKITVVPNGVSERFLKSSKKLFKNKFGLDDFILFVGHIGPHRKNALNLIKALQKIDYPSVVIGRNDNSQYAQQCISESKKSKNILMLDHIDNSSNLLASAFKCAKVFALPSLYETPGIAALEAGLAGAKIVITPFGGTKDYFKNFAQYVNPFDVDDIRKGIENKLNETPNSDLQNHIKNNFLWKNVAEQTLEVYKSVLNK